MGGVSGDRQGAAEAPDEMIVEYDDRAIDDLDGIEDRIAEERPEAAQSMRRRLIDACEALAAFPRRGRHSPRAHLRELPTVRPYLILYSVAGEVVRIRRVVHGARLR